MYKYVINGGNRLEGITHIAGSKNAVLPILAASILNDEKTTLYNVPNIEDVKVTISILEKLGYEINYNKNIITVNSYKTNNVEIPLELMKKLRSSVIFVGALLSKYKKAVFTYPGGCNIGSRPIDLHINSFKKLGINVIENDNKIVCICDKLKSETIDLDFPSVGATENLMLVSVLGNQEVIIKNAAKEPEVIDLANFLNSMGAKVEGEGTSTIKIRGVKDLKKAEYEIIPDRIEAGSLLVAAAITGGEIKLEKVVPKHLDIVLDKLIETGCTIEKGKDYIYLQSGKKLKATDINTMPYPGFPTDMQQIFASLLSICDGKSVITENIFENRFEFAYELKKLGARININGKKMYIEGSNYLTGNRLNGKDLRGTTALVLAGLVAQGTTTIDNIDNLLRGYENFDYKLNMLGAKIKRKEEE